MVENRVEVVQVGEDPVQHAVELMPRFQAPHVRPYIYPSSRKVSYDGKQLDPVPGTPKVSGFSFVDALPSPRASTIQAAALHELMTWGTIDSTPIAIRSSAASNRRSALGDGGGPFKIPDISRRERLALKMARRSARSGATLSDATPRTRRHQLMQSSTHESMSPRPDLLSPAAKELLGRTRTGKGIKGMGSSREYNATEVDRNERARAKAREVEGRERLKRAKWSESPASSVGFDPDL